MRGGSLVREARRRAGLTQRELAERLGTTQSAIARLERSGEEPTFQRVADAVKACGLALEPRIAPADDSDWTVASRNLRLTPDQRVRQHAAAVRFALAGRRALAHGRA